MAIILIQPRVRRLLLTVFYRPPSGKVDSFIGLLSDIVSDLTDNNRKMDVVLTGDANIDLLTDSNQKDLLCEFLNSYDLEQIIDQATQVTTSCSTLIDHMYVKAQFITSLGCVNFGVSDHYLIYLVKKKETVDKPEITMVSGRNYQFFCSETIQQYLLTVNWGRFYGTSCPNTAWSIISNVILDLTNELFPVRSFRVRKDQPIWYTDEIISASSKYDRLRKLSKRSKNPKFKEEAHQARNHLKSLLNNSKKEYYSQNFLLFQNNSKKFWNMVHEVLGSGESR